MFTWIWIFGIVLWWGAHAALPGLNFTSCEQFERGAKFNPYQVIDSMWKIIYFWSDNSELYPIIFSLPAKKRLLKLKETVEAIDTTLEVDWERAVLFMNPRPGTEVLFIYTGSPGAFRAVVIKEERDQNVRPFPIPKISFADVRMKIVGKYLGMMCCENYATYVLSRMEDLPLTETHCEEIAKRLGLQGAKGLSYLRLRKMVKEL